MKQFYSNILKVTFTVAGFVFTSAQYSNGYIVSNEGNYGNPNAEISYIDANNTITNNVYAAANNGEQLGDVLQSIYFDGNRSFLTVNNSNKVVVTNRSSFVKTATITNNIIQPRYTAVANGKLYTTNWGNSTVGSYVSVHDASTFAFIQNIPVSTTSQQAEEILLVNGKIYVMKASYGTGNSITVINPATNTVSQTITLSAGLQTMQTNGTDLYALCSDSSGSRIYKINTATDTVAASVQNTSIASAAKLALDGANLYVANGVNVYSVNTSLASFSSTPSFSVPASQGWDEFYGFAAIDGKIFQGSANGFTANSTLRVYNQTGTLLNTFTATMGVNHVYKNVYTSSSLSTADVRLNSAISIYPNPASDMLYVKNADAAQYKISDLSGRLVKSGVYQNGIAVSDLPKGTYMIQISDKNIQKTEKFIVK